MGQASDMSFSYSDAELTYQGGDLAGLFCDRNNFKNAAFWRMVQDILRFNRKVKVDRSKQTLGEFLRSQRYGRYFADKYLFAHVCGHLVITRGIHFGFSSAFFISIFAQPRFGEHLHRPQWMTVRGGSQRYIDALCATKRWRYRLSEPVQGIVTGAQCEVVTRAGHHAADAVVLACHSDQAATLLSATKHPAQPVLSQMKYQQNAVFLHADSRWVVAVA